jgi:hypothetical protein
MPPAFARDRTSAGHAGGDYAYLLPCLPLKKRPKKVAGFELRPWPAS